MCTIATTLKLQTNPIHDTLAAARLGDSDAFSNLVSPHGALLQRIARRFTRNVEDAEDVCQESLLKAFTKLDQFSGKHVTAGEFRAWLTKITANCAIDFLRRREGNRQVSLDECAPALSKSHEAGASGWGENPEAMCVRQDQVSTVAEAITNLPAELRSVCLLRNMMELSTKEAAARLGISALAVRLRLFRAHGQLRKNLRKASTTRALRYSQPSRRDSLAAC